MVTIKHPVGEIISQYFLATEMLLQEVKGAREAIEPSDTGSSRVQWIMDELSSLPGNAERMRLAYIELSKNIESQLTELHGQSLYPDLYRGSVSRFRLMDDIASAHKEILLSGGSEVPDLTIKGTSMVWRDQGLLDFAIDQRRYLMSTRFNSLLDAVQCYETQRYLLAQLFEYLDRTGNLATPT